MKLPDRRGDGGGAYSVSPPPPPPPDHPADLTRPLRGLEDATSWRQT